MASVIPDVGGGGGGGDGVQSFHEVDNWVVRNVEPASTKANENYMNTQESCIMKDSEVQIKINDRKAQLERSGIQRETDLNHFEGGTEVSEFCSDNSVHSNGSADEAVQMEIDSASEEDRPLELTALVKYVQACRSTHGQPLTLVTTRPRSRPETQANPQRPRPRSPPPARSRTPVRLTVAAATGSHSLASLARPRHLGNRPVAVARPAAYRPFSLIVPRSVASEIRLPGPPRFTRTGTAARLLLHM
ncbi:hypothetical protein ZWY2020_019381 [Hordeum vulgare]|nr:hypothetical protein ZWY2020_019381 [Hordeum vulgare]